jgi:hypothetical protein
LFVRLFVVFGDVEQALFLLLKSKARCGIMSSRKLKQGGCEDDTQTRSEVEQATDEAGD